MCSASLEILSSARMMPTGRLHPRGEVTSALLKSLGINSSQDAETFIREGDGSYAGDCDREPSLGWTADGQHGPKAVWGNDWGDLEEGDDNGIADFGGLAEQWPHLHGGQAAAI